MSDKNNGILVERETFEKDGKTYFSYFITKTTAFISSRRAEKR